MKNIILNLCRKILDVTYAANNVFLILKNLTYLYSKAKNNDNI